MTASLTRSRPLSTPPDETARAQTLNSGHTRHRHDRTCSSTRAVTCDMPPGTRSSPLVSEAILLFHSPSSAPPHPPPPPPLLPSIRAAVSQFCRLTDSRFPALVRHMTLVNYFPDFLLLLRDVQGQSQSVAQRQADAKSAQVAIGKALDTLRYEPLFLSFRHCCSFFSIHHA